MSATSTPRLATERQIAFIRRLQAERGVEPSDGPVFAREASQYIDRLLAMPKARPEATETRREAPDSDLKPGVYEKDGVAYIVKPNRAKDRLYAKRVVEIGGTRVTDAGTFVAVDFEYAPGAIFDLRLSDRMTGERAKELTVRYGRCICCGRDLKAGESVEQGIGPVCVKNFPELVEERKAIAKRARQETKAQRAGISPVAPESESDYLAYEAERTERLLNETADALLTPIAGGSQDARPSLTELAAMIEGGPVETAAFAGDEADEDYSGEAEDLSGELEAETPERFPEDPRSCQPEDPIDAEARAAREIICKALYAARMEGALDEMDSDQALRTFDRLAEGYER